MMSRKYNTDIPGWISEHDLDILANFAEAVPDNGNILEIGSFVGRSTLALFYNKPESVNLSIVDTFQVNDTYSINIDLTPMDGDPDLIKKIKELAKKSNSWQDSFKFCVGNEVYNQIDINVGLSKDYQPDRKFDLVFIDGGHSIDNVVEDVIKFLKSDTLIIGDDFSPKYTSVATALALIRRLESRYMVVFEKSKLWMLIPLTGYWKDFFKNNNLIK